jgi:alpha-glucosidase
MTKIYIDISHLIMARFLTGIQRVVRSVCRELVALHPDEIVLLDELRDLNSFRIVPTSYFIRRFVEDDDEAVLPDDFQTFTLDDIEGGSIFFDLDSVWNSPKKRSSLVPELKARGIKWVAYVYDICPITHPQCASQNTIFNFIEYLGTVIRHADAVIVSTKFVEEAFKRLCDGIGRKCPPVSVSWLGCDFNPGKSAGEVDKEVSTALQGKKYILSVGTLEPRKNLSLLFDAFTNYLVEKGIGLVIVGKIGWQTSALCECINSSPHFGRDLFHFQFISDATLSWLYDHAFATALPTLDEGFGLPLVESFLRGVPALVSDIPVMREVGGDLPIFFNNQDEREFADKVVELVNDEAGYAALKSRVAKFRGVTWHEVSGRMYEAIQSLVPPVRKPRTDVRQLVLLTARFEDAQTLLPYIDRFMPFIDRVLLLCPDQLAARRGELDGGRLNLSFLCDSQILAGEPLPEDHAKRNFFLRCLAMRSDMLEDVFIMSDDDYRPMTTIEKEVFVDGNSYKGYYSYDLRKWLGASHKFTSFDVATFAEREFLEEHDYPTRQYASHMPQIIEKSIFLEMLDEHKGIETKGYLDWDVYFNYLQAKYPSLLEVRPYVAMCWPGSAADWPIYVKPPCYLFENHYPQLYVEKRIFSGIPDVLDDNYEENCHRKIALYDGRLVQFLKWAQAFKAYEDLYEKRIGLRPYFKVLVKNDNVSIHLPEWLTLTPGGFVRIPILLEGNCEGLEIRYRLRDADGKVVYDFKNHPEEIVPEPPVLSLSVYTHPGMASFELYATRDGVEYSASTPLSDDRPPPSPVYESVIQPLQDEKWRGATTFFGDEQPYYWTVERNLGYNSYCNPCAPFLVSSAGRYIWSDHPFSFFVVEGVLTIRSQYEKVEPVQAGTTLREAFLAASRDHFPPSGRFPDPIFFSKPQFNTWVESRALGNSQSMVENYMDGMLANGFQCGVFIVDAGWSPQQQCGDMVFDYKLFPNPHGMFAKARSAGFRTLLWTTPYIDLTSEFFKVASTRGALLRNIESGEVHQARYYPGLPASGIMDVFDEDNCDYFENRYKSFMAQYGFDGYKFDFTDAECVVRKFVEEEPGTPIPNGLLPCDYTGAWGRFATRFQFHELRAGWKIGGQPVVVRLQDKKHDWDDLRRVIPDVLAAGILGCPYVCPDMIGGGCGGEVFARGEEFDPKLFVRSCQVQACMPMMQFSAAPWRLLGRKEYAACRKAAELHVELAPKILELARHAAETGEPIIRQMEYVFPHQGFDHGYQQFMLGDDLLVVPVVHEDDHATVCLPAGKWRDDRGKLHIGPAVLNLEKVPLNRIPRYSRLSV